MNTPSDNQLQQLARQINLWASELGFQQCSIVDPDLTLDYQRLQHWLEQGYHGQMGYLENHGDLRQSPYKLVPGSCRIISVRMDYLPPDTQAIKILNSPDKAYIARYTLGRDYHKTLRKRLSQLGDKIRSQCNELGFRAFVDSAPLMERPIAEQAGLGWVGKHTLILNRHAGSWFFLGELLINLPLPVHEHGAAQKHCGRCTACLDICPTQAFPRPYVLDARRCISYLTIEHKGTIAEELRPLMGNRIFGCDDCQLICPWNRFARHTKESDFHPRHNLDNISLLELFNWDEAAFLKRTEGSAIRRTGYEGWQRNLAIALGNSRGGATIIAALKQKRPACSPMVQEHIDWAINQLEQIPAGDNN